jgi:PD-(D/E)XK endonuclease
VFVYSTNHKGAVAEAMIAAHAIRLGIDVLKPMAEHGRYDLLFNLPKEALRVQCKWAPLQDGCVLIRVYSSRRVPKACIGLDTRPRRSMPSRATALSLTGPT